MREKTKFLNGFTLVEILVSVLILGLLFAGVYGVLSVGNKIFREDINLVELQQQVRQAMDWMVKKIRESRSSNPETPITITDGNTKITFYVPPAVYGDPWDGPISYYLIDANNDGRKNQIIREYPQGTRKILANLANDKTSLLLLNFSLTGNSITEDTVIEIKIAAKKTVQGRELCFPVPCQTPQKTLKEIVKLRNENK